MIKYIKRKDLDLEKYNYCIENSLQSRVYALSWYLDVVANNWDVLVLNDYEVVMPIPWKRKYGIKYVTQPHFCQQLGIFSISEISGETQKAFLKSIPKKFLKVSLNLNASNFILSDATKRINYIFKLNTSYNNLFNKFSRTRKQRVRFGFKHNLEIKTVSIKTLITIQSNNYNYKGFSKEVLVKLTNYVIQQNKGQLFGVYKEDELLGGGLFVIDTKRVVYLFSSFNEKGRKYQAASFLINFIIEKYQQTNTILDFEGGNLPNIATFFKSFGAEKESYSVFNRTFL